MQNGLGACLVLCTTRAVRIRMFGSGFYFAHAERFVQARSRVANYIVRAANLLRSILGSASSCPGYLHRVATQCRCQLELRLPVLGASHADPSESLARFQRAFSNSLPGQQGTNSISHKCAPLALRGATLHPRMERRTRSTCSARCQLCRSLVRTISSTSRS